MLLEDFKRENNRAKMSTSLTPCLTNYRTGFSTLIVPNLGPKLRSFKPMSQTRVLVIDIYKGVITD